MIFQEVRWIREYSNKIAPNLRKQLFLLYRPTRYSPCFINKFYSSVMQRWRKIPVIVQLDRNTYSQQCLKAISQETGCSIQKDLYLLNAFATKINVSTLKTLVENKNVVRIWYDEDLRAILDIASATVESTAVWEDGITGKDVTIAVIDTGVHDHPDLSGRIVGFKDFVNNKTQPYDDNGHGTHVAGCAAASGKQSNSKYRAPAPEANIVGIKVLNKSGSGPLSTVIQGIQWCVANQAKYKIRIINLSLGSDSNLSAYDDPVCFAVKKAWDAGLIVCAAAGNTGPDSRTINSPGTSPKIITVGAIDDHISSQNSSYRLADFSSRGPTADNIAKPDVVSPGVNITALRSPGSLLDKMHKSNRVTADYLTLSGTSMATPICAGIIAQILEAEPTLTPDGVKNLLKETALRLSGYNENEQGAGIINVKSAIQKLRQQ
ncbi:MAG: S8 family peptidase [Firmicutes bacterium]|nr:S8 family peptidase [Bacillota bacterium]